MQTLAKLSSSLNWHRQKKSGLPRFFLFTDQNRLPDPRPILHKLPRGSAIIVRHKCPKQLELRVKSLVPLAKRLHLKVLVSNNIRLALKLGADGVHLSERTARLGPQRIQSQRPHFITTAAAHSTSAIWRAKQADAGLVFISPVFLTKSHPHAMTLGHLRAIRLLPGRTICAAALGGVTTTTVKRLNLTRFQGFGAIEGWS